MKDINVGASIKLRAAIKARVAMYDNDWANQLDDELKKQFHPKTYEKIKLMADTSMNIFRRIVREICTVYREPADRDLVDVPETTQEKADSVCKEIRLDQTMQVAHRYAKAATCSFIFVRAKAAGGLVLRVLTPDQVIIEADPEDSTLMALFAYEAEITDTKGKCKTIWIVYTNEERWYCDAKGKALDKDPRTDQVYDAANVYSIIPAVAFPAEFQVRDFWNETWNRDAFEANLKIGLLSTYMNYLVKTQSFKQITINAEKISEELKDQILDPLFPLMLSGQATASTLDLNTQLGSIEQVIRGKVAAIANNYGISNENFTLTTQAASGFSLKIANQALQDIREADIPLCASVEQALYNVLAKMHDALPEGAQIHFDPGEVSWPEEWTTEQARWEFEFKNGISSPVDYLLARDPQMTRDEGLKEIQEKQAEIKQLKPSMSPWEMIANQMAGGSAPPAMGAGPSLAALSLKSAAPTPPASEPPYIPGDVTPPQVEGGPTNA